MMGRGWTHRIGADLLVPITMAALSFL